RRRAIQDKKGTACAVPPHRTREPGLLNLLGFAAVFDVAVLLILAGHVIIGVSPGGPFCAFRLSGRFNRTGGMLSSAEVGPGHLFLAFPAHALHVFHAFSATWFHR